MKNFNNEKFEKFLVNHFLVKMKINMIIASTSAVVSAQRNDEPQGQLGARRYDDLHKIAKFYMPDFDERKYWAYGCNCLILGDRPMSDPGMGKPVDELDVVCKAYKDCVKCVQMEYGETCIGEFKRYRYGMNTRTNQVTCKDAPGTCERALCECDNQFGQQVSHRLHLNLFSLIKFNPV